jgi:hypothetical protein
MPCLYYLDRATPSARLPFHLATSERVAPETIALMASQMEMRVVFRAGNVAWMGRPEAQTLVDIFYYPSNFFQKDEQGPLCRVLREASGSAVQRFSVVPGYEWVTRAVAEELLEGWRSRSYPPSELWFIEQLRKIWADLPSEPNAAPSRFERDLF